MAVYADLCGGFDSRGADWSGPEDAALAGEENCLAGMSRLRVSRLYQEEYLEIGPNPRLAVSGNRAAVEFGDAPSAARSDAVALRAVVWSRVRPW